VCKSPTHFAGCNWINSGSVDFDKLSLIDMKNEVYDGTFKQNQLLYFPYFEDKIN
jgi:hypothetical protein